jgi:hydroxypyruvate isomerase
VPPRFAAAISYLFPEYDLLDRFSLARECGFAAVELALPYDYSPEALQSAQAAAGLEVILFTAPLGDFLEAGEGLSAVPGRQVEFADSIRQAKDYAEALDCPLVQVVAGRCSDPARRQSYQDTLVANLIDAAESLAASGIRVVLEAINDRDFPHYLLSRPQDVWDIIERCAAVNIGAVLDTAHLSAMDVDVVGELLQRGADYAHVQLADGPLRCAPGEGELDFPAIYKALGESGYAGWLGAEYRGSVDSLGWMEQARRILLDA